MFANFIWSWILVALAIFLVVLCFIGMGNSDSKFGFVMALLGVIATIFVVYITWSWKDPIYWIYEHIIFNVLNFISLGFLEPVLYFENAPMSSEGSKISLFLMGAVSANAKFRDGHKYQGIIGLLNAWMAGFVLLYAMLYHGLLCAIIVHALYDLEFAFIRYIGRKVDRLQPG
jgi:hypothetical protein